MNLHRRADAWIKTEDERARLRRSGRKLAEIMQALLASVRPGLSTGELGRRAETSILEAGGEPIFKGYGADWGAPPFPAAVCLSLNQEVVHGVPKDECILRAGDLLKIDIGMRYEGMVTDMARTVGVGQLHSEAKRLQLQTEASLLAGIAVLRDGVEMTAYAKAVEGVAHTAGFTCVRDLVGHGVGRELHESPQIPNFSGSGLPNFTFRTGMVVALEPMVNAGDWRVRQAADGWTFVTQDGSLSAHFEDTVLITDTGSVVLTRLEGEGVL